jgi:asparagine synthase (glutamine-hydrolysing)
MCGISGVFSNKRLETDLVSNSIEKISHRGPDERGFFVNEYCSLGMCRLSIIDISNGKQPSFDSHNQIVSVFNGEIYNFKELRKNLESKGYRIPSSGDSVLIPYLYQEYGLSFVKLLQGMFAIAILDTRNQELILIRDRLGKKPLWYCHQGDNLSFSSELKGLFALGIQKSVNLANIPEYLRFGYINAPRSPYEGIKQLEPASILRVSRKGIAVSKYWDTDSVEPIKIGFEEAKHEATRLLEEAVRTRMISERPIGAFLSGGIDSTIVSALMARISGNKIHTFSIGFDDSRFDESAFARNVASCIRTHHHEKVVSPDPVFIIEKIARSLDSPFADSSIIPTFLLAQFARESVVVALSGDGGDEGFGGYQRYIAAYLLNKVNPLLYISPFSQFRFDYLKSERFRKLLKHSVPKKLNVRYRDFQSLLQENDFNSLLNPEILNSNSDQAFFDLWSSINTNDVIRKMQEVDIHSYLPGDLLYKVDMASMANSLEVRSPFLDYRLIEFGLSLPASLKFSKRENKHLLREIARSLVPREIIDRPKMGFGIPRSHWLRNELRELVSDVILSPRFQSRGWFNYDKVKRVVSQHDKGQNLDQIIWPILMLELWAQNWVDS